MLYVGIYSLMHNQALKRQIEMLQREWKKLFPLPDVKCGLRKDPFLALV